MALHSIDEDTSKTSNSHPTLSSSSTASSMYSLKSTRSSDVELQAALFAPFCPKIVSEYLQVRAEKHMEPEQSEFYASVLFLDITGFTNLSEAMCQIGPEGVSLLATVINDYFGTLNQLIMAFGGDVLKFCGDAVMAMWTHAPKDALVMRATCCAIKLQQQLGEYEVKTVNRTLRIKITISAGKISSMFVGGERRRWEYLISGPPLRQLGPLGDIVKGGEVLLTVGAWDNVRGQISIKPIVDAKAHALYEHRNNHRSSSSHGQKTRNKQKNHRIPTIFCCSGSSSRVAAVQEDFSTFTAPDGIIHTQTMTELRRHESFRQIKYQEGEHQHLADRNILPQFTACVKVLYVNPDAVYNMDDKSSEIFPKSWSQNHIAEFSNALEMFVPTPVSRRLREFHQVLRRGLDNESYSFIEKRLAEMRKISVIFINLHGLLSLSNEMGLPYVDLNLAQTAFATIQRFVYQRHGSIRQIVEDDKGMVCIATFGVSASVHEDIPARAVLAAIDVHQSLLAMGIATSIGVTSGKAYCGIVGDLKHRCMYTNMSRTSYILGLDRSDFFLSFLLSFVFSLFFFFFFFPIYNEGEFCVMGDIVNLSARLMSKAMKTQKPMFVCKSTKTGASSFVDFISKGKIKVKGKNIPVEVYVPTALEELVYTCNSAENITKDDSAIENKNKSKSKYSVNGLQQSNAIDEKNTEKNKDKNGDVVDDGSASTANVAGATCLVSPSPTTSKENSSSSLKRRRKSLMIHMDTLDSRHMALTEVGGATRSHITRMRQKRHERVQKLATAIGRESEIATFSALYREMMHSNSGTDTSTLSNHNRVGIGRGFKIAIVEGAAGIGKSTLAKTLAQNIRLEGGDVIWGAAGSQLEGHIDLYIFRSVLIELFDLDAFDELPELEHMHPEKVLHQYNHFVQKKVVSVHPALAIGLPLLNSMLPTTFDESRSILLQGRSPQVVMDLRIQYL